jgi:hypothetical protein
MSRLLLIAVVVVLLLWAVRRAIGAGRNPNARGGGKAGKPLEPPARLICGECGAEFDAERHGWICPRCRK